MKIISLSKAQKLKSLRKKLTELEEVKLKEALAKYGEAYQESGAAWQENAAWELADEEVSVIRAMISEIKREITGLEHPLPTTSIPLTIKKQK
ncbi:hypothetical protein A3D81_02475 [Candidatus Curtissbacteria bacterium RIFCSPHIGHO2_02_FULL_40_17]|uniref:Transcription elongation factor GreA/GreB N-terminal domain-containing protein n=3 Tax=Candidatus Curtissiibacteriota TaxID=1752717 RepID=A0A1F5GJE7_9BACT|nr:MAG: hypothetical protein A2693_04140 [Candidatus Curtissbacteria bacterium RIFCSPHIGHO2_01_FULL_40_12]OGD91944.1 MAG: hypothetical protein A3D81_02475 [Candidatus Curtissbacteria bacterium RIFCSPHIGHO2_02_FULL_40_17]OGE05194.1 MAG: hypothetical protein A3F45_01830 [Candidatus Curtissbacteria bacterium RIFCSPHIGHO2_12_FULL_41_17]